MCEELNGTFKDYSEYIRPGYKNRNTKIVLMAHSRVPKLTVRTKKFTHGKRHTL